MGFIGDLFDAEARKRNRIASLSKKLQQKFGQTEDRMTAARALAEVGGAEAWRGLLKRFTISVDNRLHDQDEKKDVSEMLVEGGAPVIPLIQEFLGKETELTWALRTLSELVGREQWATIVLETLEGHDSENTDPEKLSQILLALHENPDPRVAPAVTRLLADLDDTIRFAAIETLASLPNLAEKQGERQGEDARAALLSALTKPEEESQRVIHRILEVFRDKGWEVKGFRKSVEERLPEGWYLDRSGRIKQLERGAARPPDEGA